jgi:hypothetical protein
MRTTELKYARGRNLVSWCIAGGLFAGLFTGLGLGCSHEAEIGKNTGGSGGGGGQNASSGTGGGFGGFGYGGSNDCGNTITCSADLHNVLDGCGQILSTCPPDKGCAPGGNCVPACEAASQNQSSVGCDYYALAPISFPSLPTCFAAFVSNTWGSPLTVSVDYAGQSLSGIGYTPTGSGMGMTYTPLVNDTVPPGQVAIFFLSDDSSPGTCPEGVKVGVVGQDVSGDGSRLGNAFHIAATAPVVSESVFPYGGGTSIIAGASLLLPTSAWGDNYVSAADWTDGSAWVAFVAQEDATDITIVPTASAGGSLGSPALTQNVASTFTLNRGQMVRFQNGGLTGSLVKSTKPIGSWGGYWCTPVTEQSRDSMSGSCDGDHDQLVPIKSLGSEYLAVRYRNRHPTIEESPPWRIVGAVNGTTLSYDPPQAGAPSTIDAGQVLLMWGPGPFVIKSQDSDHPFELQAYMTDCELSSWNNGPPFPNDGIGCAGDPDSTIVVPPAQYLNSYVFFTDPTYPETNLVFTREKGTDGLFHDVTLDCAGVLTGWQPIGGSGRYEYTRADLQTGNWQNVGNCNNGSHEAHSDLPFGLTVWGWGTDQAYAATNGGGLHNTTWVSYSYPAGMSVRPINTVVVPPVPK